MNIPIQTGSIRSDIALNLPSPVNYSGGPNWNPFNFDLRSVSTVDLNGDGYLDIFIHPSYTAFAPSLAPIVLLNDGTGRFHDGTSSVFATLPLINQSNGVFFKDFNSDGRNDLFIVDQGLEVGDAYVGGFKGSSNHLYLQDSNGVFRDATAAIPQNAPAFNHVSSVTDINSDGKLDILVTRIGGPAVEGGGTFFYLGDGKGGFSFSTAGLPEEIKYLPGSSRDWNTKTIDYQFSGSAGAADLDNDGRQDLITGSYVGGDQVTGNQTVRVFAHESSGNFVQRWQANEPAALKSAVGSLGVAGIVASDLNGDGLQDVIVRWENGGTDAVEILQGLGNFQFKDVTVDWLGSYIVRDQKKDINGNYPSQNMLVEIRDVNHDGMPDIVLRDMDSAGAQIASGLPSGAFLYLNDGTGHFSPGLFSTAGTPLTSQQLDTLTGNPDWSLGIPLTFDVNNDGKSDYVFLNASNNVDTTVTPNKPTMLHVATLLGAETSNVYRAGDVSDSLVGSDKNDIFYSGKGADTLNGGEGIDIVKYSGTWANFAVRPAAGNARNYTVTNGSGAEGVDTLLNVERIAFADATVAIDIAGNGGQAYRLYQAAFDRAPDQAGLGFQMWAMDDLGMSLTRVAQGFIDSPEFAATYGNLSNKDFVAQLYANVLHRAPDAAGLKFHVDLLDAGAVSRAQDLVGFSESPENQAALIGIIGNGFAYIPH